MCRMRATNLVPRALVTEIGELHATIGAIVGGRKGQNGKTATGKDTLPVHLFNRTFSYPFRLHSPTYSKRPVNTRLDMADEEQSY